MLSMQDLRSLTATLAIPHLKTLHLITLGYYNTCEQMSIENKAPFLNSMVLFFLCAGMNKCHMQSRLQIRICFGKSYALSNTSSKTKLHILYMGDFQIFK